MSAPKAVGDVTGDGRPDVVLRGAGAEVEGSNTQWGALWVLSELHTLASSPPSTPVSLTDYAGAIVFGHSNEYLADIAGLDLDADGQQDLAVLTTTNLYLFRGPLQGLLDLGQAAILGAGMGGDDLATGDLTGDGIVDFAVGDPVTTDFDGEVRIYDGAAILSALP